MISSPVDLTSDDNNYLNNLNCEWHIRMPLRQKLKLAFVKKFGIEKTTNCSTDFLEVCVICGIGITYCRNNTFSTYIKYLYFLTTCNNRFMMDQT